MVQILSSLPIQSLLSGVKAGIPSQQHPYLAPSPYFLLHSKPGLGGSEKNQEIRSYFNVDRERNKVIGQVNTHCRSDMRNYSVLCSDNSFYSIFFSFPCRSIFQTLWCILRTFHRSTVFLNKRDEILRHLKEGVAQLNNSMLKREWTWC